MNTSSLPRPAGGLPPCLYLVEVTPARRGRVAGYRVQVFNIDGVAQLTESVLPWRMLGPWRSTHAGALHVGVSEAYELRAGHSQAGPLVVFADGVVVVDERAECSATSRIAALTCQLEQARERIAELETRSEDAPEPIRIDVRAMAATYAAAATSRTVPAGSDVAPAEIDDSTGGAR